MGWSARAQCVIEQVPLDVFFSRSGGHNTNATAKAVCQRCEVREDCLAEAMLMERGQAGTMRAGVYGGLDGWERAALGRRVKREERKQRLAPKQQLEVA